MTTDNSDSRDYILDLSSNRSFSTESPAPDAKPDAGPKYLSVHFKCCNVYAPIYRNAAKTAYAGHCPKCRRRAEIAIGPGGSKSRIFQAE